MNLTITSTFPNAWRRYRTQSIAAAAAIALAVSAAVVGVVALAGDGPSTPSPTTASTLHSLAAQPATIYIVASQAQADQIIANESEVGSVRQVEFIVVDSPEKEYELNVGMSEMAQAGSDTRFVDARGR